MCVLLNDPSGDETETISKTWVRIKISNLHLFLDCKCYGGNSRSDNYHHDYLASARPANLFNDLCCSSAQFHLLCMSFGNVLMKRVQISTN